MIPMGGRLSVDEAWSQLLAADPPSSAMEHLFYQAASTFEMYLVNDSDPLRVYQLVKQKLCVFSCLLLEDVG